MGLFVADAAVQHLELLVEETAAHVWETWGEAGGEGGREGRERGGRENVTVSGRHQRMKCSHTSNSKDVRMHAHD